MMGSWGMLGDGDTAGELLEKFPRAPSKLLGFGEGFGDCKGLVMDGRDSSATLGMTWVIMGNDGRERWNDGELGDAWGWGYGGGTFVKVPPRPLKTF